VRFCASSWSDNAPARPRRTVARCNADTGSATWAEPAADAGERPTAMSDPGHGETRLPENSVRALPRPDE